MRSVHAVHVALLLVVTTGCYTLQPVDRSSTLVGDRLAFEVNDVGRVALATTAGPEIARLEGSLLARPDDGYVVGVTEVRTLRGATQVWKGERVELRSNQFTSVFQRRYSRVRTYSLAVAALAAGVFIGTRSLSGGGTEDPGGGPPPGTALRIP